MMPSSLVVEPDCAAGARGRQPQALAAGKHVHSEKPLALRHDEARELVELATERGVRLSSAPATLLGEAQQSLWKLVRDGAIGRVRVVYAEANWDRIERWHPDPTALYAVGPLVDVGIYPLAILTAMFGPVRRVQGTPRSSSPTVCTADGRPFRLSAPDFVVALLELTDGVIARLTATFYVPPSKQRGLELHGDDGSLYLAAWMSSIRPSSCRSVATGIGRSRPCASRITAKTGAVH